MASILSGYEKIFYNYSTFKIKIFLNTNFKMLYWVFLCTTFLGCKSDDDILPTFLCCAENPFASTNIEEINVFEVFTPNGDGFNDFFLVQNIEFYPNNSVTIFDLSDNIIFEMAGYNNDNRVFWGVNTTTGVELNFGSYKYKIILGNGQFPEFGYVCFIRNSSEANGFNFLSCNIFNINDPLLN